MKVRPYTILMDAEGTDGGGSNPTAAFQALLDKHKQDTSALAAKLFDDNHALRQQLSEARAKVPKEGSVVLSGKDALLLESYQALGAPGEIQKLREERDTAVADLERHRKAETYREAGEAHGFKPTVLEKLAADLPEDATIEIKQVGDGKDRKKVAYVVQGDKRAKLDDYAAKEWPDFLPALKAEAPPESRSPSGRPQGGTPARPRQAASGGDTPAVDEIMADLAASGIASF